MGDPGRYLSAFTDAYAKERGLQETIRRGDIYETHEAFRIKDYLDNLERENQAQGTLATILRNRQQAPPPGAPVPGAPTPGGPPAPPEMGEPVPMGPPTIAAGGMAALGQPPARGAVHDALMQGVSPEAQAQFLTTQTGRSTWPTIEAAERERRQAEDREQAEGFMTKATESIEKNDPAGWADHMAAFYRRIGQHDKAAKMMEYSAKIRTDKQEEAQAPKDFEAIYGAIQTWQTDPTPANFSAITNAMSSAKSMTARALSLEVMKNAIGKKLAQDPDEHALLQHVGLRMVRDKVSEQQAWEEAMQRYPAGMVKIWQRALIAPDKVKLPDAFYKALRVEAPLPFKGNESLGQRAYLLAIKEAQEQGFANDPVKFTRRWNEIENEMVRAQKPEKKEADEVDLQLKQERLKRIKKQNEILANPQAATVADLTLWIQRISADIDKGNLSKDEEEEQRQTLQTFRDLLAKKRQELGGAAPKERGEVGAMPPASKYKGQTIRNPETGKRYRSDGKKWVEIK